MSGLPSRLVATCAGQAGWLFKGAFIDGIHLDENGQAIAGAFDRFQFWAGSVVTSAGDVMDQAHHVPKAVVYAPFVVMVLGFLLAYWMYIKNTAIPGNLARMHKHLYQFLLNKWYFDEIYDALLVKPASMLGRFLWKRGDQQTIDGLGPDGVSSLVAVIARKMRVLQTGYLYHYAFAMMIGVALFVTWLMTSNPGH